LLTAVYGSNWQSTRTIFGGNSLIYINSLDHSHRLLWEIRPKRRTRRSWQQGEMDMAAMGEVMECGKGLACEGGSGCNARRWRSPRRWRYGLVKRHDHGSGCCRVVRRVWVKEVAALLRGCWKEDDVMEGVSTRFKGK